MKKLCAILLAVTLVVPVIPMETGASVIIDAVIGRLANEVMDIVDRSITAGVNKACGGLEEDSPIAVMQRMIFGDSRDATAELCEEILEEVKEVDENVTDTRDYLAGLISSFASNENVKNLSAYTNDMNTATAKIQTAWNCYLQYVEATKVYSETQLASDKADAEKKWNTLYSHLENIDFETVMTTYIGYVCETKAHIEEGTGELNASKTYLYWLHQFCETEYAFDYQKYETMSNAISRNVGDIQQMMELHAVYVQKQMRDYEAGILSEAEMGVESQKYENSMNIAINAINDIAGQYAEELRGMMRRYDMHVSYDMDYSNVYNVTADYILDYPTLPDADKTLDYTTTPDVTYASMDFYRVGAPDGKTYLFLKQDADSVENASLPVVFNRNEITAASLFESFETDDPKSFTDMAVRMKSADWMNLLSTKDGKYAVPKNVSQLYSMISNQLLSNCNNNLLTYVQSAGGLQAVASNDGDNITNYLFINDSDNAVYDYGLLNSNDLFITARWAKVSSMSLISGGFDTDTCIVESKDFATETDKNVMVVLQSVEDAVFEYGVNQQVQGSGSMTVKVEDTVVNDGTSVQPGKQLAITVLPDAGQTLESLVIQGEEKDWLDSSSLDYEKNILNEKLADSGDFEYMAKNEDGSVTYYFTMPYQECTITANFVKDLSESYTLTVDTDNGTGSCNTRLTDAYENILISYTDASGSSTDAVFGEALTLEVFPDDNCYISDIRLTDTSGNLIMHLSCLKKVHFVMPEQDCTLVVELTEQTGTGTIDDPYLIPDYDTLVDYINKTQGYEVDDAIRDKYRSAHYRVTQNFSGNLTVVTGGMYLSDGAVFDGQNKTIRDLNLACGLFETVEEGAEVRNVVLERILMPEMTAASYPEVGTLVKTNSGLINHCEVKYAEIEGRTSVGGLVYENTTWGVIRNSGVDARCSLEGRYLGGIACLNNGYIQNCYFSGTLVPVNTLDNTDYLASGITPRMNSAQKVQGIIDNCYVSGTLDTNDLVDTKIITSLTGPIVTVMYGGNQLITRAYYTEDGGFPLDKVIDGTKYSGAMNTDTFRDVMNAYGGTNVLPANYYTWVRSDAVNSGYPTFEGQSLYSVSESVTGSGSVIITRENGAHMGTGIVAGETINITIEKLEGVTLQSLKVCKTDDLNTVLIDYGAVPIDNVSFTMPSYNVTVVAEFSNLATEYNISTLIDGIGEIELTDAAGHNITSARTNDVVYVKAVPGTNYSIRTFEVRDDDGNVIQTFTGESGTFTMGDEHYVVYAKFAKGTMVYKLTSSVLGDDSGTINLTNTDGSTADDYVEANTLIQANITPDDGYYPSQIRICGSTGSITTILDSFENYLRNKNDDGTYTVRFCMPEEDCDVQVTFAVAPKSLILNEKTLELVSKESRTLTASIEPAEVTDMAVIWESSDESVVTVDKNGVVTAVGIGTATIKASLGDLSDTCEVTVKTPLRISRAVLQLENDISIVFKAAASAVDGNGYTGCYVEVVQELENGETKSQIVHGQLSSDGLFYNFLYTGVNLKEVGDNIDITLYAYENDELITGETKQDYSVMTYCTSQLKKTPSQLDMTEAKTTALKTLLVDLVNYGSEGQKYFSYKTDALVNEQLTEEQKTYASDDSVLESLSSVTNTAYKTIENPTVTWNSAELKLMAKTNIRVKFTCPGDMTNVKVVVKVAGGETYTITELETLGNNTYGVYFDEVRASQFGNSIYFQVLDGDEVVSNTLRYSVESYAVGKLEDAQLGEIVSAMMKYGKAAAEYNKIK